MPERTVEIGEVMVLSDTPCRAVRIASRTHDGEAVLVDPGLSKVMVLNDVGARLWELADGSHTIGGMARVIAGEYEVDLATAESDVLAFCRDLAGRGLLIIEQTLS